MLRLSSLVDSQKTEVVGRDKVKCAWKLYGEDGELVVYHTSGAGYNYLPGEMLVHIASVCVTLFLDFYVVFYYSAFCLQS